MSALAFLQVDGGSVARSPLAGSAVSGGAVLGVEDGWELATGYGDLEQERSAVADTVGFADRSSLGKLEQQGDLGDLELGRAERRGGAWWCPVTRERTFVLCEAADTPTVRASLDDLLDVTSVYAALAIAGPLARELFARFCALDLRDSAAPVGAFRPGSVARTPGFVLREAGDRWLVLFGAAYAEYMWTVVSDAAARLGGRPVRPGVLDA